MLINCCSHQNVRNRSVSIVEEASLPPESLGAVQQNRVFDSVAAGLTVIEEGIPQSASPSSRRFSRCGSPPPRYYSQRQQSEPEPEGNLLTPSPVLTDWERTQQAVVNKQKRTPKVLIDRERTQHISRQPQTDLNDTPLNSLNSLLLFLNDEFQCPITLKPMQDPVTIDSGHTFDRNFLEKWLTIKPTCPVTRQTVLTQELKSNYKLKNIKAKIDEFKRCSVQQLSSEPEPE